MIASYIETQARAAFRDFLVEERGLPRHTIENMGFVSSKVADIVMDQGISLKEVTSDMVYEKMEKEIKNYTLMLSSRMFFIGVI